MEFLPFSLLSSLSAIYSLLQTLDHSLEIEPGSKSDDHTDKDSMGDGNVNRAIKGQLNRLNFEIV